jgi:hypothetical protein
MGNAPRATRFDLKLPVQYRAAGDVGWMRTQTENVSRTGVLFTSDKVLEAGTRVEVLLELLPAPGPKNSPPVLCTGQVVRISSNADGEHSVMAVNFTDYRFAQMPRAAKA